MTERDAPFAEEDGSQGADRTRPYGPGSRLRRALDLARESHLAATRHRAETVDDEPAARPDAVPGGVPPSAPVRVPEAESPGGRPTASAGGAAAARPHRRGLGRGLDALLPRVEPTTERPRATWETAVQGWVDADDGLEWRTVVTTADRLEHWTADTYLGIVSGRAEAVDRHDPGGIEHSVRMAVASMVEAAEARGAHGVIGVTVSLADGPDGVQATAVGSAVTLENRR